MDKDINRQYKHWNYLKNYLENNNSNIFNEEITNEFDRYFNGIENCENTDKSSLNMNEQQNNIGMISNEHEYKYNFMKAYK